MSNAQNQSPLASPLPAVPGEGVRRYRFTKAQRLHGRGTFKAVLDRGTRKWAGPLALCVCPNDAGHSRLGISIGRPVGNAATRNRIKRLLREAFRQMQHDWPAPHDAVVLVKKHAPLTLAEYQKSLSHLMVRCLRPKTPQLPPPPASPSDSAS